MSLPENYNPVKTNSTSNRSLILEFQGLRGLAILGIVLRHWDANNSFFTYLGTLGVSVFLILSGFLACQKFSKNPQPFSVKLALSQVLLRYKQMYWIFAVSLALLLGISKFDIFDAQAWLLLFYEATWLRAWIISPLCATLPDYNFIINGS